MPDIGKGNAASVAANFRSSFGRIILALVVGICSRVPNRTDNKKEVLLGDMILSTRIVQYDFGRKLLYKFFRKDTFGENLGSLNTEVRSRLAKLKGVGSQIRLRNNTADYLAALLQKPGFENIQYPGVDTDKLFEPIYCYKCYNLPSYIIYTKYIKKDDKVCIATFDILCSELKYSNDYLVPCNRLVKAEEIVEVQKPCIYFSRIASGDTVCNIQVL
jgi:hypothetical protein